MLFQYGICEAALLQIEMFFFFLKIRKMYVINQTDCMDSTKKNKRKVKMCTILQHVILSKAVDKDNVSTLVSYIYA